MINMFNEDLIFFVKVLLPAETAAKGYAIDKRRFI